MPIGIHCIAGMAIAGDNDGPTDEIFAVVASPDSGKAVRIHHKAQREPGGAEALGRLAAKMLIDAGAMPLLEAAGGSAE